MKKRWLSLVLALVLAAGMLSGCGGTDETPEEEPPAAVQTPAAEPEEKPREAPEEDGKKLLRIGSTIGDESPVYDPAVHWNGGTVSINALMFETLLMPAREGGVGPGAAESWEVSPDGLTYTLHLREGMKWSDGQPLTAHDFAYTIVRALTPETASASISDYMPYIRNADKFYKGEVGLEELGVRAVDDATLVLELNFVTPFFAELLMTPVASPTRRDIVEADPEHWSLKETGYPSAGPFTPTSVKFGTSITFEKNENYWNAENIKLDGVKINYFADANTCWSAYQAGELDLITYAPGGAIRDLYTQNSEELQTYPVLGRKSMMLNNMEGHLDSVALRMAVISAIDRQALIDSSPTAFMSRLLNGVVPEGCIVDGKDFRKTAGSYYYQPHADLEASARYLEEAGYPGGAGLHTLEIMTTNDESALQYAQIIQEQLKAAGMDAQVVPIESKAYFPQMLEGKYDVCVGGDMGSIAHPMNFLMPSHANKESNPEHYHNPAYDEAFDRAKFAATPKEQLEGFMEAERIFVEDAGRLLINTWDAAVVHKPYVKGFWANIGGTRMFSACEIVK